MAVGYDYELYVDGTRVFYGNTSFEIYCGEDQFTDMSGYATGSYTYNAGQYAGWTTTQGSTTPEYAYQGQSPVSDIIIVPGKVYLYSIPASAPTGKTQIGTRTITKKMFGTREITKEVVNGVVVYEKQASYPSKGDIINIDMTGSGTPQQFRVLKVNGSVAEVLSMSDASSQQFASSGQTYENGVLDIYLNSTWYNTLSATAKAAIVDKTFRQDSWYWNTTGNPVYQGKYSENTAYQVSLGNASFGNEITRHAYAISVQDVIDYLEVTPQMTQADTALTYDNVRTMFWNSTTTYSGNIWLRSASASNASNAFRVIGGYGYLFGNSHDYSSAVRPAFQIDLSKIQWN